MCVHRSCSVKPGPHWGCMHPACSLYIIRRYALQPAYGRMQAACRLHASVSGAHSTGLQYVTVIIGVDAGMHDIDDLHAACITIVKYAVTEHVSSRRTFLFLAL